LTNHVRGWTLAVVTLVTPLLVVALLSPVTGSLALEDACPCEGFARAPETDVEPGASESHEGCERDCELCLCCSAGAPFAAAEVPAVARARAMRETLVVPEPRAIAWVDAHGVFRPPRA
jgi:hypothetical protein